MGNFLKTSTTRRAALSFGAASLTTALLGAQPAAAASKPKRVPARFDDPVWNREQSARLEAHTDGRQIYGMCSGSINGVRPGEAVRHLLNFEVFSTIRVLRRPDGNYDRMTKEVVFYSDPATGEMLDEWHNPYLDEQVRVVDIANDPYNWVIRDWVGPPPMPNADIHNVPKPADAKPFLLHWTEFGKDTVVMEENGHVWYPNRLDPVKWPRESVGTMVQASEMFRYFIKREDLEDPAKDHLPHNGVWIRITPWLPWMLMGQAPGHILYNGMFRRTDSLDEIKPTVLARVRERHPQYLTAPTAWYGPNMGSLEHYAQEQKPAPVK
jgi:hypothetical protein